MDLSSETAYQLVRILFAVSLLGFLFLVIRITMRELQQPASAAIRPKASQLRAQLLTVSGEAGSPVPEGIAFDIHGASTVGRAQTARVVLDDSSVSAQHALLRTVDGVWTVEDLGSRNGTLVNGHLVTSQTPLACGDSLQFGRVRLRLMC